MNILAQQMFYYSKTKTFLMFLIESYWMASLLFTTRFNPDFPRLLYTEDRVTTRRVADNQCVIEKKHTCIPNAGLPHTRKQNDILTECFVDFIHSYSEFTLNLL